MNLRVPKVRFAPAGELTGRKVLLMLVAFFGVVMVVNVAMMKAAISTFGGVDTKSSYEAGRQFKAEEARAAAQNDRDWQVSEHLAPSADGQALTITVVDEHGVPVSGVDVQATMAHPVDERRDVAIALAETTAGSFHGAGPVSPGLWQLDLVISRDGHQLFRSRNRVLVP
jgi:nitrogen fixation protein FixH